MQTYQFKEFMNNEGVLTLSGLPCILGFGGTPGNAIL